MPDWKKSMVQTFEYYIVDPDTWSNDTQIRDITDCSISRDSSAETLGSASITCGSDLGEVYIRAYLITLQNGIKEIIYLSDNYQHTEGTQASKMMLEKCGVKFIEYSKEKRKVLTLNLK